MTRRQFLAEINALEWLDDKANWRKWEKELTLWSRFMAWLYKT